MTVRVRIGDGPPEAGMLQHMAHESAARFSAPILSSTTLEQIARQLARTVNMENGEVEVVGVLVRWKGDDVTDRRKGARRDNDR